jgi:hypothetical protein
MEVVEYKLTRFVIHFCTLKVKHFYVSFKFHSELARGGQIYLYLFFLNIEEVDISLE